MPAFSSAMIQEAARARRTSRRPNHNFYLEHRPWQIQPMCIAPVLPNETLTKLSFQSRAVTNPIANPIIGWWDEYAFFYVKHRDLYVRDTLVNMFLDPSTSLAALDGATNRDYYHINGTDLAINWPKLCLECVVDNYFRDEGEVALDYVIPASTGLPVASVNINNFAESSINVSAVEGAANIDQNLVSASAGQGDATTAVWTSEIERAMREFALARYMGTTKLTFEQYCAQYGVSVPKEQLFKPERIAYYKNWQYPSNTIDPTSGAARSAVSWSHQHVLEDRVYFPEPGFIFGVTITRPKIYFQNLDSHATMLMNSGMRWLPPGTQDDPAASFCKVTASDPPLDANTGAYLIDLKDLLLHGDQFTNLDLSTVTGINKVALPNAALTNRKYPASTDADNLFVDTTAGAGKVKKDGIVSLTILGAQEETSPVLRGTNKTV